MKTLGRRRIGGKRVFDIRRDCGGNVLFCFQQVCGALIECLGPNGSAGRGINQLSGNANVIAIAAGGSAEQFVGIQEMSNLLGALARGSERGSETRVDHMQRGQALAIAD